MAVFLAEGSSDPQGQLTPTASQSRCLAIDLLAGGLQNGVRGCVNKLGAITRPVLSLLPGSLICNSFSKLLLNPPILFLGSPNISLKTENYVTTCKMAWTFDRNSCPVGITSSSLCGFIPAVCSSDICFCDTELICIWKDQMQNQLLRIYLWTNGYLTFSSI